MWSVFAALKFVQGHTDKLARQLPAVPTLDPRNGLRARIEAFPAPKNRKACDTEYPFVPFPTLSGVLALTSYPQLNVTCLDDVKQVHPFNLYGIWTRGCTPTQRAALARNEPEYLAMTIDRSDTKQLQLVIEGGARLEQYHYGPIFMAGIVRARDTTAPFIWRRNDAAAKTAWERGIPDMSGSGPSAAQLKATDVVIWQRRHEFAFKDASAAAAAAQSARAAGGQAADSVQQSLSLAPPPQHPIGASTLVLSLLRGFSESAAFTALSQRPPPDAFELPRLLRILHSGDEDDITAHTAPYHIMRGRRDGDIQLAGSSAELPWKMGLVSLLDSLLLPYGEVAAGASPPPLLEYTERLECTADCKAEQEAARLIAAPYFIAGGFSFHDVFTLGNILPPWRKALCSECKNPPLSIIEWKNAPEVLIAVTFPTERTTLESLSARACSNLTVTLRSTPNKRYRLTALVLAGEESHDVWTAFEATAGGSCHVRSRDSRAPLRIAFEALGACRFILWLYSIDSAVAAMDTEDDDDEDALLLSSPPRIGLLPAAAAAAAPEEHSVHFQTPGGSILLPGPLPQSSSAAASAPNDHEAAAALIEGGERRRRRARASPSRSRSRSREAPREGSSAISRAGSPLRAPVAGSRKSARVAEQKAKADTAAASANSRH